MIETIPQQSMPESQFSVEEHDAMVMNALLGSIEDLSQEFSQEQRERSDEEILSAVQGVYTAGSEHYNGELASTMQLFEQFAARLGQMACNHDHFSTNALGIEAGENGHNDEAEHAGHKHEKNHDDEYEIDPKTGKRVKKKKRK